MRCVGKDFDFGESVDGEIRADSKILLVPVVTHDALMSRGVTLILKNDVYPLATSYYWVHSNKRRRRREFGGPENTKNRTHKIPHGETPQQRCQTYHPQSHRAVKELTTAPLEAGHSTENPPAFRWSRCPLSILLSPNRESARG